LTDFGKARELVFPDVSSASFEAWQKPQNAFISKTHLFPSLDLSSHSLISPEE
jgi:hypothetical protein